MPKPREAGSPPAEENTEAVAAPAVEEAVADANAESSSPSDDEGAKETPKTLLDVVTDAVKPEAEVSPAPEEKQEVEAEAKTEEKSEEEAKADDDPPPFHEHPRWKEQLARVRELEPKAERQDKIEAYMAENELTSKEVAEGFVVMAALKRGTREERLAALNYLRQSAATLEGLLGETLPADLQSEVDEGLISEDRALELSRTRAAAEEAKRTETARAEKDESDRTAAQVREHAGRVMQGVQDWEDGIKKADPDYPKFAGLVEAGVVAEMTRTGMPKTVEEAVALSKRVYEAVSATFKAALPKPRAVDTSTPAGSSVVATKAPSSLREAVDQALAGS